MSHRSSILKSESPRLPLSERKDIEDRAIFLWKAFGIISLLVMVVFLILELVFSIKIRS